ncbi:MAG: hypothetical protein A2005_11465 [Desulfuromonadales bacterium GWC2_61_20]|nr:MAG: hypothetical protein A2005_11465 [Desulfuromonadales bacterium GWC2_61_20]
MSRYKEIIKSSASILSSQFASALISIVFLAYFARVFSKEQMAIYATLTIFSSWNEVIGGLGMGTLLIKDVAGLNANGRQDEANRLISSVFVYRTLGILLTCIVWAAAMPFVVGYFFVDNANLKLVLLAVVISFFMALRAQVGHVQVALQTFHARALINVGTTLVQRVFCVLGFFAWGQTGFYYGFLFGTLVGLGMGLWDIRQCFSAKLMPFREIIVASRGYWTLKWIRSGAMQADRPLVAVLLGPEGLASYHMVKRLYDNLYTAMTAFAVPMGVKFGEVLVEGRPQLTEFYRQSVAVIGFVFIPLGFFICALGKPILALYGGAKYAADGQLLSAFGMTLIAVAFWTLLREAALRLVSARHLATQYLVTVAITLTAYGLLIPLLGVTGVPVAMTLGFIIGCIPLARILFDQCALVPPLDVLRSPGLFGVLLFAALYPLSFIDNVVASLGLGGTIAVLMCLAWLTWCGPMEVKSIIRVTFRKFLPGRA